MGTIVIEMPKLSDTMDAGVVISWKKKEGDEVSAGDILAEVESDKATMELEAYDSGYIRQIVGKEGESIPVGAPLAVMSEEPNEDISGALEGRKTEPAKEEEPAGAADAEAPKAEAKGEEKPKAAEPTPEPAAETTPETGAAPAAAEAPSDGAGRLNISPVASRLAQEMGLDVRMIRGTGPGGRIVKRDIEKAKSEGLVSTRPIGMIESTPVEKGMEHPELEYEDIPNSQMRKVIAQRLSDSKSQIPHYYVTMQVRMDQALLLREQLNALDGVHVSVNDFVIKAAAVALEKNPLANASFQGQHIRVYHRIDIGMAVAMEEGLITPVVRDVNKKGLLEISREARELAERARSKKLKPDEFTGSTFTVSNLGMTGVKAFTAVINPPEAAILAVGTTREVAMVKEGEIVIGHHMDVTVSSDHRVLDGMQTAKFLADFKYFLENPITFAL